MKKIILSLLTASLITLTFVGCNNNVGESNDSSTSIPIINAGDNNNDTVGDVIDKGDDPNYAASGSGGSSKPEQSSNANSGGNSSEVASGSIVGSWSNPNTIIVFTDTDSGIHAQITLLSEGDTYEGTVQTDHKTYIPVKVEQHFIDGVLQDGDAGKEMKYTIKDISSNSMTLVSGNKELKLAPFVM